MYGEAHSKTRKDADLDGTLCFRDWPLHLQQMWEQFSSARINRELRFISGVGLATCIACLFFDAQANVLELGLLLRLGLVAPSYLIGIALLKNVRGLTRTMATVTPIVIFASVASCLGLAAEGAFTERYLIATAVLIAFSVMFLPLRSGATLFLAIVGNAAIVIPVFAVEGVQPETIGLYVFVLICCAGPIAIKLRSDRVKDSNFLLTLKSRQAQEDLLALNRQLEALSNTDPLTAVLNRRGFEQAFAAAYEAARQSDDMMAVLLLDIDHFKQFNDTYGHQAGDQCLVEVGRLLGGEFALHEGITGRYGGEEFIAALFGNASREAEAIANRVRKQIGRLVVADGRGGAESISISISISIGVCIGSPRTRSRETFVTQADRALYAAKDAGRDRVVMLTDEATESNGGDAFGTGGYPGYAIGLV